MDKDTIPIKDVVKKVISKISEDEDGPRIKKEDMQSAWECVVGRRVAAHSKPVSLRKGRLVIHVSDSSLLYDLTCRKKTLLRKLSEKAKSKKIKQMQFRIGEI